jgi:signal transduction histidine kinase
MKRKLIFILPLLFFSLICRGQSPELTAIEKTLPGIHDSTRYVDALNRMAMLLFEKNVDSTFYYATRAREVANRLKYVKGQTDALNNLGVVYDIKGNHELSLRYYNEALNGYVQLRDTANIVQAHMDMALVFNDMGRDKKSVSQFKAALVSGKGLSKDSIMALVIYNYLLIYPGDFRPDSVSYYIRKAKSIAGKFGDTRAGLAINQLLADDDIRHSRREKGLKLLKLTIDSALEKKLFYVSLDMLIDMGDNLISTDTTAALSYYRKALDVSNRNGYLVYSQTLARKLFDFYSSQKRNPEAFVYSRLLVQLHDQQEKLDNSSGVDYIDYALKNQQLESLKLRSEYQTITLIGTILACLTAVIAIWVISYNLRKTRTLNHRISDQNRQMKNTLGALEQSQDDNTRMMKIVAHDLRNPIGATTSIADLMLETPGRSEEDRMMLELIKTSGKNSLELVSDLLQVHTKTEELKKEPIDLDEMLRYCVEILRNKAEAKGQNIVLQSRPLTVNANREKFWRVISNLIANAIKFSPTGAGIKIAVEEKPSSVLIAVEDHGIGIPADMADKIFDMFTSARRQGTAGEQPFGLGLAISKQIVEAHGGRIWFESRPDNGTTFFVEMPG